MKLVKAQVLNFRSVEDSGVFEIGDLTCLVGKNEAGKTAILRAIQGINPTDGIAYDLTRDYPRRYLNKFDERHPSGESPVARTWWTLDDDDMAALEAVLGDSPLSGSELQITSHIGSAQTRWVVPVDEKKCLRNLEARCSLTAKDKAATKSADTPDFGHFVPANWLLRHPELLDEENAAVLTSLDRFEQMFKALNALL